ncbi:MAG: exodeoxyribonuclease VII small subunit [Chloroflexota bacterium]
MSDETVDGASVESFEEAFRQLQETVERLESGGLPLAEALDTYERAMDLAGRCRGLLDRAELRITQLTAGPEGAADDDAAIGSVS